MTNEQRTALKAALSATLRAQGKTCLDMTGKDNVSKLHQHELYSLAAALGVDVATAIAITPAAPQDDQGDALTDVSRPVSRETIKTMTADPYQGADHALAPLEGVKGFLAPAIWDTLRDNVAGVYTRLDKALKEAKDAREALPLRTIAPAAPGVQAAPSGQTFAASKIFNIKSARLDRLTLPVWNDPGAPAVDPNFVWDDTLLADLLTAITKEQCAWMFGPPGTGKTSAAMQLAANLGRPFFRVAFDRDTEAAFLWGGPGIVGGSTIWQDGKLTKALRTPGAVVLLDEPTICPSGTLATLQTTLDHRFVILETGERVDLAPGVIVLAADNTNGRGDTSGNFIGTAAVNAAFMDRFAVGLDVGYPDKRQETKALILKTGAPRALADAIVRFAGVTRAKCNSGDLTQAVGFRRLVAFADWIVAGVPSKHAFKVCVLNLAHGEDVQALEVLAGADLNFSDLDAFAAGLTPADLEAKALQETIERSARGDAAATAFQE
jgi:MoxR-like ATPase